VKAVWAVIRIVFRGVSYLAFVVLAGAFGAISFMLSNGVCARIDTGAVLCGSPAMQEAASLALSVALLAMFTGIPVLLAVAGFVLLLRDLWRLSRRLRRT